MGKKSDEILRGLIKEARARNFSDVAIKNELVNKGYPSYIIQYYLRESKKSWVMVGLVVIIIIAVITVTAFFWGGFSLPKVCMTICDNKSCFIELADRCESARFVQDERGNVFSYESNGCILTKSVVSISANEPLEVQELLQDKSMDCFYEPGFFNVNWVNTLTIDSEDCSGDLRQALQDLSNR